MGKKKGNGVIETDVVIVGGGLAGLTTAVGLQQNGLNTIVLERRPTLGGRARSWTDEKTGDPIDIGPHILLSEYPNMFKFLDMLGTRHKITWNYDRFILVVDGQTEIETKHDLRFPPPLHYAPSLWKDPTISHIDTLSNLSVSWLATQLTEDDIMALDNINAAAFLRAKGVTENFIRRFWSFICLAIMNVPLELCSAGSLLRFYRRLIGHREYYVGFADGGLGNLFAPQAQSLLEDNGGQVWLNTEVSTFTGDGSAATGVALADGRQIRAKACVGALPPQALRRVLRSQWLKHRGFHDLVSFQPSPYVSTYIWFDRKLTDQQFWARAYDKNDLNCDFYDLTNINKGWKDKPSVITTNCIYCERAAGLTDEDILDITIRELSDYLPEAANAKILHSVVNRIPMAIHCPFVGTEQLRQPVRSPVKNLFLAGDWIRTGLPSSMESACMAGWLAAEEILADAGKPQKMSVEAKKIEGFSALVAKLSKLSPFRRLPRWVRPAG